MWLLPWMWGVRFLASALLKCRARHCVSLGFVLAQGVALWVMILLIVGAIAGGRGVALWGV